MNRNIAALLMVFGFIAFASALDISLINLRQNPEIFIDTGLGLALVPI